MWDKNVLTYAKMAVVKPEEETKSLLPEQEVSRSLAQI